MGGTGVKIWVLQSGARQHLSAGSVFRTQPDGMLGYVLHLE